MSQVNLPSEQTSRSAPLCPAWTRRSAGYAGVGNANDAHGRHRKLSPDAFPFEGYSQRVPVDGLSATSRVVLPDQGGTQRSLFRDLSVAAAARLGPHDDSWTVLAGGSRVVLPDGDAAEAFRWAVTILESLADEFPAKREYRQQLGRCYIAPCEGGHNVLRSDNRGR